VGGGGRAFRRNARKELNVELVMFVRFATLRSGGGGGGGGGGSDEPCSRTLRLATVTKFSRLLVLSSTA